jgi:4-amino-4-deoxy-L-arabinose transferase-like glycosyltransferase
VRRTSRQELIFLSGALLIFLALTMYQLWLPGPHYDEAVELLPALQLLQGRAVHPFRDAGLTLFGRTFPLMTQDYIGALNTYLALPFLLLLGVNVHALRLMPVLCSALALLLLYRLAAELYGRRAGLMAVSLLAVNPSFIFWSRQGVFVTSLTAPIALGAAWCWLRWWRTGRLRRACLGAFLCGLGLYAKFLFLWIIFALIVSFLLLQGGRWLLGARKGERPGMLAVNLPAATWPLAALSFLLGLAPLALYNVQTGGTISSITGNLATSYYGTNNLAFFGNLQTRLGQFVTLLDGGHFWYLGGVFQDRLLPLAFALSLVALPLLGFKLGTAWLRRAAFPFLVTGAVIVASCATVSALWVTHYAILIPWPLLAIAAVFDGAWEWLRGRRAGWLIGLLALAVIGGELRSDVRYHKALAQSGGLAAHSAASYELAEYLDRRGYVAPLAMDWGIAAQVEYLTAGRVRPIEIFGYGWEADPAFESRLALFLESPDSVYIFHSPPETVFPRREAFDGLVREAGKRTQTEAVFSQRNGQALYLVVRVTDR